MKFKARVVLAVFALVITKNARAAVVDSSSDSFKKSTLEWLKLPPENRQHISDEKVEKYYRKFLDIAFDEKEVMSVRWRALMAAADIQGVKSTKDLIKAGQNKVWFMRNAALVALAEVNPPEAQKLAHSLVKDKALVVRSAAVEILKDSTDIHVRKLLWTELNQKYNFKKSHSLWIRHQIVQGLAETPVNKELISFAHLLRDEDGRIHEHAIRGLEKLTGVKLGADELKTSEKVVLWKKYLVEESVKL